MDIRQLEYFLAIVDHGGFNRAAAALYVSQPSLSQAVRALERDLGSDLFHRIGRKAVLTEAGKALIEPAREAVRSLHTARARVSAVRELRRGQLDIVAMPSPAVDPLTSMIQRFSARYPDVSVRVRAAFVQREVTDQVRAGSAELGLLASPDPLAGGQPLTDVRFHPVCEQRFVLVAPPGGPFSAGDVVACQDLAGRRLIVGQPGTAMRAYVDGLRAAGVDFAIVVETELRVVVLPLVLAGVGFAVLTESWRPLAERAGATVLDIEPATTLKVALVSRRAELSPAAHAFLTCCGTCGTFL